MTEIKKLKKKFQADEVKIAARSSQFPKNISCANRIINLFDGKVVTEKINEEFHIQDNETNYVKKYIKSRP